MIRWLKTWLAARQLEKLTRERRDSFEIEQYRRRRAAALKATRA